MIFYIPYHSTVTMIDIEMLKTICEFEEMVTSPTVQCQFNFNINGNALDAATFAYVAQTGDIKLIKYLHKKNCPWDTKTCENLAKGGFLECLIYVHQHGCPLNKTTCLALATKQEIIDYLITLSNQ